MPTASTSTSPPLAYLSIKSRLLQRLETDWPAGTRLPPMPRLARALGAGQTNTHRAVQALVAEGRLVTRRGAGTFVAPIEGQTVAPVDAVASQLAGKQIEMITSTRNLSAMVSAMVSHAASALTACGGRVTMRSISRINDDYRMPAEMNAAVVVNPDRTSILQFASDQLLTVITTGAELSVAASERYDVVGVDQEQGGYLAGEWAKRIGCQHPCYVGVQNNPDEAYDRTSMMRLFGFEQGLGRPVPSANRIQREHYGPKNGALAAAAFVKLDPRPDVVFCASDELAVGFVLGASSHGLEVGRDFHIVGFDRQQSGRELEQSELTTIEVPAAEMGRRAADMLVTRFDNPDQPVRRLSLGCALVEGTT